jgi:hypothetical protein
LDKHGAESSEWALNLSNASGFVSMVMIVMAKTMIMAKKIP